jgi:flagellar hook-basal body complex protein FliE
MMYPIAAIPSATPAYGVAARPEIVPPETLPAPGVDSLAPAGQPGALAPAQAASQSFASLLGRMVEEVNARQNVASDALRSLQSGGNVSLHQAVIAMEEASLSFQLMVEVRNKLLEAYQEIMRMQI